MKQTMRIKLKSLLAEKGAMETDKIISEIMLRYPEIKKRDTIRGRLSEMCRWHKEVEVVNGKYQLVFLK